MATTEPPPGDSLSRAERESLLGAMSAADRKRAERLARVAAAGLADMGPDDLLHEVYVGLLSGARVWRRGVSLLVTLKMAMLSVASNERKKATKGPIDRFATVSSGIEEEADGGIPAVHAIDERTPECVADGRSQLAWIEQLVEDDADAKRVLHAWACGLRGVAAQVDSGLDAKRYDAARQRLQRKLDIVAEVRYPK